MSDTKHNGIFVVSLDFELYWGVHDKKTINEYKEHLDGVRNAVEKILELFDKYGIHATWATVGFLFCQDMEHLKKHYPKSKPSYINMGLSPYQYVENNILFDSNYHFAPKLIDKIYKCKNQEIATHTFSHYYCLEEGQTIDQFNDDISSAINVANKKGISIKSLVFPKNQFNKKYISVLDNNKISAYRGNESSWFYNNTNANSERLYKRALRLLDAYINISGYNCYSFKSLKSKKPYNIRSSRFLRPVITVLSIFEGQKKRRIINAMIHAAKNGEVFHLWWHPHNFGTNTDENIKFLSDILTSFLEVKNKYGMQSMNMKEVSNLIDLSEASACQK